MEPKNNIDALLGHLPENSLSYKLVLILKEYSSNEWPSIIDKFLSIRLAEVEKLVRDAENTCN